MTEQDNDWSIHPGKESSDHYITCVFEYDVEYKSWWSEADIKWDGCVHYRKYSNDPAWLESESSDDQLVDYLHICSLKDLINELTALRELGKQKFGADWDE